MSLPLSSGRTLPTALAAPVDEGIMFSSNEVYFSKGKLRDDKARAAYREELEREDLNGLFIRDIVKEGILPDDPRLR